MKFCILLFTLLVSTSALAGNSYVEIVRNSCRQSAGEATRARMTRFERLWSHFLSENLNARPYYLKVYGGCMIEVARRNGDAARVRQLLSNKNMIDNIRSLRATNNQISEIAGKSTVCLVDGQLPQKLRILQDGYAYIGKLPNDHRFDWYWQALETFVYNNRIDYVRAFGVCRVDRI